MIDKQKNETLKKMWQLKDQEIFSNKDKEFFNKNLGLVKKYYKDNSELWSKQKHI